MEHGRDILVVDDDTLNRDGICLYLERQGYRVYEAGDASSAWQALEKHRPDVVVLDIVIPASRWAGVQHHESEGIRLARRIKKEHPVVGVVLFSAHEDRGALVWALLQQGHGGIVYTLKGRPPQTLLRGIRDAHAGRVVLDPAVMAPAHSLAEEFVQRLTSVERPWVEQAAGRIDRLTPREREVLNCIAASYNLEGIADYLGVSPKTVENHSTTIYDKLGLKYVSTQAPTLRKTVILTKASILHDLRQEA